LTSFGGPVAHLGYLRAELVERRAWLTEAAYADLVALCQFLPGPASSQLVFALGQGRAGWWGGLLASLCFTLPSAALMILFGYGVTFWGELHSSGWLHGLKLATVAVVAQAVWALGRTLCPDLSRLGLALAALTALLAWPGTTTQIAVIMAGAGLGCLTFRARPQTPLSHPLPPRREKFIGGGLLASFAALLLLLPLLRAAETAPAVAYFDSFYRAGALVFGGGHVVLPLLRAEVVPPGWVSDPDFLAGYGAAQAVPGPLFTFAGYLGTLMGHGPWAGLTGAWCLLAIFLPAWLLIGGALPFWHALRAQPWAQAALRGANAVVVGILLAAFYHPVCAEGLQSAADILAVLILFGLLQWAKSPPWLVVLLAALGGQLCQR
ncbi:MAG TPA: chromate efflux transporter, partial [Verrucomicrobiae bacterium]